MKPNPSLKRSANGRNSAVIARLTQILKRFTMITCRIDRTLLASLFGLGLAFAFLRGMLLATGRLDHLRTADTSMGKPSPRHIRYSASCRISKAPQGGVSALMPA